MLRKKIFISAGGTGGHVYPAISFAKQIQCVEPAFEPIFAAGGLQSNPYFDRSSFPYHDISCGTLSFGKPWKSLKNTGRILKGIIQSIRLIKQYDPALVVGFGSYHTLPLLLAARLLGVPFILHEANRIPGKVNRLLAKHAALVGTHFPDTRLKGKCMNIEMPLREGYRLGTLSKREACAYFGLSSDLPVLLVFGGSQGAQKLNLLTLEAIRKTVSSSSGISLQILHFTGDAKLAERFQDDYTQMGIASCVKAFEPQMNVAWQAADCMISRSGAGTVAELVEFEIPGILVPYPFAADNHQESNANFVCRHVKGALRLDEDQLTEDQLAHHLILLFEDNRARLSFLRKNIQEYKKNGRSKGLCKIAIDLLHHLLRMEK